MYLTIHYRQGFSFNKLLINIVTDTYYLSLNFVCPRELVMDVVLKTKQYKLMANGEKLAGTLRYVRSCV